MKITDLMPQYAVLVDAGSEYRFVTGFDGKAVWERGGAAVLFDTKAKADELARRVCYLGIRAMAVEVMPYIGHLCNKDGDDQ